MGHPTASSHGSSGRWVGTHCKDTAPLSEHSQRKRNSWELQSPSLESQAKRKTWTFRTPEKGKRSRREEKALVWQPSRPAYMLEDNVFFSCLASLSGFLKDAKSVYLKQRLLACVKRKLSLYIRLLFILFVVLLFGNYYYFFVCLFVWHNLWTGTFVPALIIYFSLDVLC